MRGAMGAVFVAAVLAPGWAGAAEEAGERVIREEDKVVYEKETRVEFNDGRVDGSLLGPDGDVVRSTRRAQFESMIQKRQDFLDELQKSVDE